MPALRFPVRSPTSLLPTVWGLQYRPNRVELTDADRGYPNHTLGGGVIQLHLLSDPGTAGSREPSKR